MNIVETELKGIGKKVIISRERPTVMVGERINPTGRKRLAQALISGDLSIVKEEAQKQIDAGADVLDVNVGAAGVDEIDLLPRAVRLVLETVSVPVCIDSASADARGRYLSLWDCTLSALHRGIDSQRPGSCRAGINNIEQGSGVSWWGCFQDRPCQVCRMSYLRTNLSVSYSTNEI